MSLVITFCHSCEVVMLKLSHFGCFCGVPGVNYWVGGSSKGSIRGKVSAHPAQTLDAPSLALDLLFGFFHLLL